MLEVREISGDIIRNISIKVTIGINKISITGLRRGGDERRREVVCWDQVGGEPLSIVKRF